MIDIIVSLGQTKVEKFTVFVLLSYFHVVTVGYELPYIIKVKVRKMLFKNIVHPKREISSDLCVSDDVVSGSKIFRRRTVRRKDSPP